MHKFDTKQAYLQVYLLIFLRVIGALVGFRVITRFTLAGKEPKWL